MMKLKMFLVLLGTLWSRSSDLVACPVLALSSIYSADSAILFNFCYFVFILFIYLYFASEDKLTLSLSLSLKLFLLLLKT